MPFWKIGLASGCQSQLQPPLTQCNARTSIMKLQDMHTTRLASTWARPWPVPRILMAPRASALQLKNVHAVG